MITKALIKKVFPILFLIIVAIFFRVYQMSDRYFFDWDQEDDATKVTEMINNFKPRLIGPRVANESGFFVGPFHYYFLTPFYFVTKGSPYAGAYASIFVSLITVIVIYFLVIKIFNPKIAFISALFTAASSSIVSWNVMYTPLLSILTFYLCYLLINGKKDIFPYIVFLYSFSFSTHLVPVVLILPIIVAVLLSKFKLTSRQILLSIILFIIPLLPLIAFDLKHSFINSLSIKSFIFSSKQASEDIPFLFMRTFWRSINPIFLTNLVLIIFSRIITLLIILFELIKTRNKKMRIFMTFWIISPLLVLAFYHGNIPEYYYGTSLVLFPILVSSFINRFHQKQVYIIFVFIFLFAQSQYFLTKPSGIVLKNKLNLAKYLVNQTQDKIFNLSYDLPIGFNSGYNYLFKYLGKEPQDVPEGHLYSVFLNSNPPKSGQIVYSDNVIGLVRK